MTDPFAILRNNRIGPVLVGLGHDTHLGDNTGRTYCGRTWTSDERDDYRLAITCRPCLKAYGQGRHPRIAR